MQTILRVKMGYPTHSTDLKTPGNQTTLDWAEVTRFQQERDKAAIQKEKDILENRKREVRAILDKQTNERMAVQRRKEEERMRYESDLLARCNVEIEAEKKKQAAYKAKLMLEKEKMEKLKADQLKDKQNKLQSQMIEEAQYLTKVRQEIENEQKQEKEKKRRKGEEAARIL